MLGSIIHNDKVVGQLEALGARQVQSVEDVHPGDTVLLAGKGHETYQILRDGTIHLDEREVVADALKAL